MKIVYWDLCGLLKHPQTKQAKHNKHMTNSSYIEILNLFLLYIKPVILMRIKLKKIVFFFSKYKPFQARTNEPGSIKNVDPTDIF